LTGVDLHCTSSAAPLSAAGLIDFNPSKLRGFSQSRTCSNLNWLLRKVKFN
jgi:hypothetical protein